jgi:hypothetical protein
MGYNCDITIYAHKIYRSSQDNNHFSPHMLEEPIRKLILFTEDQLESC